MLNASTISVRDIAAVSIQWPQELGKQSKLATGYETEVRGRRDTTSPDADDDQDRTTDQPPGHATTFAFTVAGANAVDLFFFLEAV